MSIRRFDASVRRLLELARQRIRAGELSERGLARLAAVSQPHMHNILAGKRGLQPAIADRLLDALGLEVADLAEGIDPPRADVPTPWLAGPLGGGRAFPGVSTQPPARFFEPGRLALMEAPFLARVAPDERSMAPTLQPGDDLLLECAWKARQRPKRNAVYAIEWNGQGYLCRCQALPDALLTVVETQARTIPPPRIPLEGGVRIGDIVRGEVVWFGRMLRAL